MTSFKLFTLSFVLSFFSSSAYSRVPFCWEYNIFDASVEHKNENDAATVKFSYPKSAKGGEKCALTITDDDGIVALAVTGLALRDELLGSDKKEIPKANDKIRIISKAHDRYKAFKDEEIKKMEEEFADLKEFYTENEIKDKTIEINKAKDRFVTTLDKIEEVKDIFSDKKKTVVGIQDINKLLSIVSSSLNHHGYSRHNSCTNSTSNINLDQLLGLKSGIVGLASHDGTELENWKVESQDPSKCRIVVKNWADSENSKENGSASKKSGASKY
jgi:hypothetical protein